LWYVNLRKPAWNIVEAGTCLTSDNLDITSKTLVVVPPKPGVIFSTVRKLEGDEEFTYIILLKYGDRIRSYSSGIIRKEGSQELCKLGHFGKWAETTVAIELNGKPIEVSYRVELNETCTAVANESLTVEGNYVDMASGQVFLVDLTAESPIYRQMKVELPVVPMRLETKEEAERASEAILRSLGNKDLDIKAFLS
jgi:hypothetical protein